jgi:hypothetical protein
MLLVPVLTLAAVLVAAAPAMACGGLVAPGHAEVLQKATTLAAWHNGFEHYVTGFQFAGAADRFGYIVPLPGVPTKIEKAGDWTLERLEREINPVRFTDAVLAAVPAAAKVAVIQRVKVAPLDITVVRGGGADVAAWAAQNGFDLSPDAPKVLGAYSSQGAVFALAKFSGLRASKEGLVQGQGTIVHFTIPTRAPWVPLRILALGKAGNELVDADIFTLTDDRPDFAPVLNGIPGMKVRRSGFASPALLSDLRSDRGMRWLPARGMWFTAMSLHTVASAIRGDLSIDGGAPPIAAAALGDSGAAMPAWAWAIIALLVAGSVAIWIMWRPDRPSIRPA